MVGHPGMMARARHLVELGEWSWFRSRAFPFDAPSVPRCCMDVCFTEGPKGAGAATTSLKTTRRRVGGAAVGVWWVWEEGAVHLPLAPGLPRMDAAAGAGFVGGTGGGGATRCEVRPVEVDVAAPSDAGCHSPGCRLSAMSCYHAHMRTRLRSPAGGGPRLRPFAFHQSCSPFTPWIPDGTPPDLLSQCTPGRHLAGLLESRLAPQSFPVGEARL